jgi:solute carrier family 12 sodium/potassium/chloride transporter 2
MSKNNKFGAFGGVFTPSVLTILGVIMYLRLGWVVGQAGIIFTLLIILGAHFVSITTGLSVSSVATDRKVKAGGLYYMLSRSLGLPIGGSIGITLFVGTALSISMYIVGFSESFNDAIGFVGNTPEARMMNLRITGSLTLFLITTVALISTSFAIKTQ